MAKPIVTLVKQALADADFDLSDELALRLATNLFSKNQATKQRFKPILDGSLPPTAQDVERLIYLLEQVTHRTWCYDGRSLQSPSDKHGSGEPLSQSSSPRSNSNQASQTRQLEALLKQIAAQQAENAKAIADNARAIAELKTLQIQMLQQTSLK